MKADYPKVSGDPAVQNEYEELRTSGQSHNCALMFALQSAPGLQTDTRFMSGRWGNQYYSHQLQRWVGSRSDVLKEAEKQGLGIEGSGMSYRPTVDNPRPDEVPYRVADDIVEDAVLDVLDEHPTALRDDPELPQKTRSRLEGDYGKG